MILCNTHGRNELEWHHAPCACLTVRSEKKHENISIYFCRKCPEIKQVSISIQCINITFISPLPVFTPEGTIGLPSVRPSVRPSVSQSVCLSVRSSVCPLKSGSFDNLKTIEARRMKLGIYIGSNVYNMHAQHLGRYLEGQGHSVTLKQNCVRPITWLFEVEF